MKPLFAPLVASLMLAVTFAAGNASAFTAADQYGSAASGAVAGRTIVIDSHTRFINVMHGETVTIRNGDSSITWYFDGIGMSFSLSKIMPAASPAIEVYVAPELVG